MRYILNSLIVFLTILFVGMAYPRIVHASDIITPELLTRYKPGSIRWGMPKAKVKKILLKRERQPLIESSYWLIFNKSVSETIKYVFTDDDKLAFVEWIYPPKGYDWASRFFLLGLELFSKRHGPPLKLEPDVNFEDLNYFIWETFDHNYGYLLRKNSDTVYRMAYDKKLHEQYLKEQASY